MSVFGSGARSLADKIIGAAGQAMTLTRRGQASAYSPATGVTITQTATAIRGAVVPYESFRNMGFHKETGFDIIQGDQVGMLSAIGPDGVPIVPPAENDLVTVGRSNYTIINIAPHSPAGVDLMYLCNLRGSGVAESALGANPYAPA